MHVVPPIMKSPTIAILIIWMYGKNSDWLTGWLAILLFVFSSFIFVVWILIYFLFGWQELTKQFHNDCLPFVRDLVLARLWLCSDS